MQYDKTLCIVLLPAADCAIDLATVDEGWLTGILNLKSQHDVSIIKQSDTLMSLRCRDFSVKHHVLSWDTRHTAEHMFAIRVKEDLWKHERTQKANMWHVMQALFAAGLRPTWSRASVTWRTPEGRFFIHPGDLSQSLSAADIVTYAKSGCTALPISLTPPLPHVTSQHVHSILVDSSSQTERLPTEASNEHVITALRQDLSLAKQRIAAQSIQCCYWRQKYKAYEAKVGPPKLSRHVFSQTSPVALNVQASQHVSTQTDTPPESQASTQVSTVDEFEFPLPGGPTLLIPTSARDAIQAAQDWCLRQAETKAKEMAIRYQGELEVVHGNMHNMSGQLAQVEAALAKYRSNTKGREK